MSGTDPGDYHDRFVTLNGGLIIPAPAYVLALDLERRGVTLAREDRDTLNVGPSDRLTDADRAGLRRWKRHLLALVDYCTRPDNDRHDFTDRSSPETRL